MFASRVGTNPKCVARLHSLLEVDLAGKNTVNDLFLSMGHAVGVSLSFLGSNTIEANAFVSRAFPAHALLSRAHRNKETKESLCLEKGDPARKQNQLQTFSDVP